MVTKKLESKICYLLRGRGFEQFTKLNWMLYFTDIMLYKEKGKVQKNAEYISNQRCPLNSDIQYEIKKGIFTTKHNNYFYIKGYPNNIDLFELQKYFIKVYTDEIPGYLTNYEQNVMNKVRFILDENIATSTISESVILPNSPWKDLVDNEQLGKIVKYYE